MKTRIPDLTLAQAQVASVRVGELAVGPLEVATLLLAGAHVDLSTGGGHLRNLRATVTTALSLDWSVHVSLGLLGSWNWKDTIDLGSPSVVLGLGDVELPGLRDLTIDLSDLSVDGVSATMSPVRDLQLGQLVAQQIAAAGIVAPVPDFQLTGLGLGTVTVEGVALPAASVDSVTIGSVRGGRAPLGQVALGPLAFPAESVQDLGGDALDADATGDPLALHADAGVLEVMLRVTPSVRLQADQFLLGDVHAGATFQQVTLTGVVLPFELSNLALATVGLTTVGVPSVVVG